MASVDAILKCFDALVSGGVRAPQGWDRARATALYSGILRGVEDRDLILATMAYLSGAERYWPTPGALLELTPARPATWLDGWQVLLCELARREFSDPPTWPEAMEPTMSACVRLCGGWGTLHRMTERDAPRYRREFSEAWSSFAGRGEDQLRRIGALPRRVSELKLIASDDPDHKVSLGGRGPRTYYREVEVDPTILRLETKENP